MQKEIELPELPEVETVCRGLKITICGHTFEKVWTGNKSLRKPIPEGLAKILCGLKVEDVTRRAKYALIHLSGGYVLVIHLGMSGQLVVLKGEREKGKHDHFIAKMKEGEFLYYTDPRRFGLIDMVKESEIAGSSLFKDLGPEPFCESFSAEYLKRKLARRSQNIKVSIMDQALVVGVGNIYASEALFRSRINPVVPANEISLPKLKELVKQIRAVLAAAIESGGSTLRDYVRSTGDSGYFQHHFDVYDREGESCNKCKTKIRRITQSGRSTFFCPKCQA